MLHYLKIYVIMLASYLVMDAVWFYKISSAVYRAEIGQLLRKSANGIEPLWTPAVLVYLLMPAAIIAFVLPKAAEGNIISAAVWGFAFGLTVYGVYDLTNYAVIQGWTLKASIIDILWGGFVCAVLSCAAALAHWKLQ